MDSRKHWRARLERVIHTDPAARPMTEVLLSVDEVYARKVIDLAMRIGESLIAVGAAANEVVLSTVRVASALGIKPLHVDLTYNSISASYHRDENDLPFTLIRVVRAPVPDHSKLQELQALVASIERGEIDVNEARTTFHKIRRTTFLYRPAVIVLAQSVLAVGVGILFGAPWFVLIIILLAAASAALTQRLLARLRVPFFFSQVAGAFVVTMIAAGTNWLGQVGVPLLDEARPTVIVAAGIVLMLAGMSVVSAAQDAIDGFALTATGRILDLALLTLGVVVGIVIGVSFSRTLGIGIPLATDPPALGPLWMQIAGAVLISVTVAIWNGARMRAILVSGVLGSIAWGGFVAAGSAGLHAALASFVGALIASFVGTLIAHRLHVPSIAVATAAIVPMVPGSIVFRGILAIVEAGDNPQAATLGFTELLGAGAIGVALAAGASLGLFLGAPIRDTLQSVVRRRRRFR